jgi:hypothetical protein
MGAHQGLRSRLVRDKLQPVPALPAPIRAYNAPAPPTHRMVRVYSHREAPLANTTAGNPPHPTPATFQAILWGGLIVGVLDLAYAIAVYSPRQPILIPQTIASGVLGPKSYSEGLSSAALGVLLHFVIAFGAAAVYYLASRKVPLLTRRAVLCGLLYGAVVYAVMHAVVLPLSAAPPSDLPLPYKGAEFIEHGFFVGLPIALAVRRYACK